MVAAGWGENSAYGWAMFVGLVTVAIQLLNQHAVLLGKIAGRRAFGAFCTLINEKPSIITAGSLAQLKEGKVLNMMSVDGMSICRLLAS